MPPVQIHIDLETLGIRATSQILSIGACCNDNHFYREIDLSHYDDNFTTDESTAKWWHDRGGFQPTVESVSPHKALTALGHWITDQLERGQDEFEVWANSPSFDCAILRHHYSQYSLFCPWAFWQERDVRTIKNAARTLRIPLNTKPNPHNALQDALNQQALVNRFYSAVAGYVDTARQSQLAGGSDGKEIRMELHSPDRV